MTHERGIGPVEVETLTVDVGGNRTNFAENTRRTRIVPQASAAVLLRQLQLTRGWVREHLARIHHRSGARIAGDPQLLHPRRRPVQTETAMEH